MTETLLAAITSIVTFAVAAGSPGPATLAVAATAMASGRRQGLMLSLGLATGLALWGVATAIGLGLIVAQYSLALLVLKISGAVFLFYLAYKSGRAAVTLSSVQRTAGLELNGAKLFLKGVMLNLLNPKAALAWVAALSLGSASVQVTVICAGLGLGLYTLYALVFSLEPVMAFYQRTRRKVDAACACVFALAGLRLLVWDAKA